MGAKSTPVGAVQPRLLKWARETANMTSAEVAQKFKKTAEEVEDWEEGRSAPTYSQLERLAYEIYKRPLAVFFLPAPPEEPRPRSEFRSLPEADLALLHSQTVLLIRKGHSYQAALNELYDGRNPVPRPLFRELALRTDEPLATSAERVRSALGISLEAVRVEPGADSALKLWRRAIESKGIFVFKDSFKQREISGFCLAHPQFPIILVNNSTTKTRKIFSLIHELTHLLFDRNGISRFDDSGIDELPPHDRAVERFCNAMAAEVLVPTADFEIAVREWGDNPRTASDESFAALARRYHVSRSVVLRRFLYERRVSHEFYLHKDREWMKQAEKTSGGGDYYNTQSAYLSEQFLRDVVSRYESRLITKSEAADLIGVKPRNFATLEDIVLRGAA
jgi:Zn-dependent peptidase ImmA (M78 family)/transcriptional regulator with XRE-family HTH domain